ncbi:meiotic recombination protein SPO11 [Trichoplusia ni]|uniref:DNA topoisomerase (ATP-hydrolyzing) n=1 Tax=Trichoplusia ni TaxID=7111 RepID=A0A7E5WBV9_TRINI|nr:meiotic recombination protein SPO11 [Trichoplusia ni]
MVAWNVIFRMELMNADLLAFTKDLRLNTKSVYKQDAKLAAAIDKLCCSQAKLFNASGLKSLPDRKIQFIEVQELLKGTLAKESTTKASHDILKETNDVRKSLIKRVEDVLTDINKSAESGQKPKFVIRNQKLWSNCIYDLDRVTLKSFNEAKKTKLCYSNSEDKTRFNTIVFVLTKVHELLSKNLTVTRRELFYQNVVRLRNQANLDVAVRDVCCLLETPPWSLGIVATAKGLVAGPLTLHHRDGSVLDCMSAGGVLIPQDIVGIREFKSTAKYILVVEKDAIFQKLLDEGALVRLGPVIIITGKGYPDVCTRQLLCRLCSELRLQALALVDGDPHGYEIFLTYKYGSLAQSHLSSSLACTSLLLLGARYSDVMTLSSNEARLPLTELDKRKLRNLMKRPYLETPVGLRIREELSVMLSSGTKAEIEALAPTAAALCDAYLPAKIIQNDFLG